MMMAVRRRRFQSGFRTARDVFSYALGAAIVGHEVFLADQVDWVAALIGMGLLGLPTALSPAPAPPQDPRR